jgi:hypothetical protein
MLCLLPTAHIVAKGIDPSDREQDAPAAHRGLPYRGMEFAKENPAPGAGSNLQSGF